MAEDKDQNSNKRSTTNTSSNDTSGRSHEMNESSGSQDNVFDLLDGRETEGNAAHAASEVDDLKKELDEKQKQLLYLAAEFENYKKTTFKERGDLIRYGAERLARDLVTVLDIFDAALTMEISPATIEAFKKGVEMTAKEMRSTLEKNGITEVDSLGQNFNPQWHEALATEPTEKVKEGHITQVFRKAYKYHDRVLRPGQVIVARPLDN